MNEYIHIEKTETSTSVVIPKEVRFTRPDLPGFAFVVPNGTPWLKIKPALALLCGSIVRINTDWLEVK